MCVTVNGSVWLSLPLEYRLLMLWMKLSAAWDLLTGSILPTPPASRRVAIQHGKCGLASQRFKWFKFIILHDWRKLNLRLRNLILKVNTGNNTAGLLRSKHKTLPIPHNRWVKLTHSRRASNAQLYNSGWTWGHIPTIPYLDIPNVFIFLS